MDARPLLAVPNVSEGRAANLVAELAHAFGDAKCARQTPLSGDAIHAHGDHGVRLLDVHSDADHNRSVFTLAGPPGCLTDALIAGAQVAVREIDVISRASADRRDRGQHPHVGALDVAPIVYLHEQLKGVACATALVLADRIGDELDVPVFLYGELTASDHKPARTRAELRRGGVSGLSERMNARRERLAPDFGPSRLHPRAGATLVAARPPLVAFNVQLAPPATIADARSIAAAIREGGSNGLPGVRAIAIALRGGVAQVSMNIERPFDVALAEVVDAVRRQAPVASAELVGLAPRACLDGFPSEVPMPGFDPGRHLLENALGC